eukprot:TRINITY_DN3427_c0_g1_i22.p1 TRINITY_DN3427_c0_g1~~TRINITY_DN3427_c0_g1_i22.p1  ORF type:complete len:118 (+),score=5.02 TRINITY_DN3427_c0_g1_i22:141-494(+)
MCIRDRVEAMGTTVHTGPTAHILVEATCTIEHATNVLVHTGHIPAAHILVEASGTTEHEPHASHTRHIPTAHITHVRHARHIPTAHILNMQLMFCWNMEFMSVTPDTSQPLTSSLNL